MRTKGVHPTVEAGRGKLVSTNPTNFFIGILLNLFIAFSVQATVILQYHHVSKDTPPSTSISPELFEQHLDYLRDNEFRVISLQQLILLLRKRSPLPDKSVVITFDDGYRSIYENALPRLKARNFPFTVFVNTRPLIQKLAHFMSWEQLKFLISNNGQVANHSMTHPHMIRRLAGETESQWRSRMRLEVINAQSSLESKLGVTIKAFAYPYGEYDPSLKALLAELDFVALAQHSGAVSIDSDLQALPRFSFGGNYGAMPEFATKINTLALPVDSVQLLNEDAKPLASHVLSPSVSRPRLKIRLQPGYSGLDLNCFFSGEGKVARQSSAGEFTFAPQNSLPVGRSRYNCTAPSGAKGRFYWYSQPWIRPEMDGSWYDEN